MKNSLVPPDEWFTLEILAQGDHFIFKIDGTTRVDEREKDLRHPRGHIGLDYDQGTEFQVRKIEIKELPAR